MTLYDQAFQMIMDGKNGLNIGLDHGLESLKRFVNNIQRETYYLVGGTSGVGKTSFVDNFFIYNPYLFAKNNDFKLKVLYFTYELSAKRKIIKSISTKLKQDFNTEASVNHILSKGNKKIPDDVLFQITQMKEHFDELEKNIMFYDRKKTYEEIDQIVVDYTKEYYDKTTDSLGNDKYTPKDNKLFILVVLDHIGLIKKPSGMAKKQSIDELSKKAIEWRNYYGISPVFIQQFGRSLQSTDRKKVHDLFPNSSDFKDTGESYEDADCVFALFKPLKHGIKKIQVTETHETQVTDSLITFHILKDRDGMSDVILPLEFHGASGTFYDYDTRQYRLIEE